MGPIRKQTKDIKKDIKCQRHAVARAKKLAETLLAQLEKAQIRLDLTEDVVNSLPAETIDAMLKMIEKGDDRRIVLAQLTHLAQQVASRMAKNNSHAKGLKATQKTSGQKRVAPPHMTSSEWQRRCAFMDGETTKPSCSKARLVHHTIYPASASESQQSCSNEPSNLPNPPASSSSSKEKQHEETE